MNTGNEMNFKEHIAEKERDPEFRQLLEIERKALEFALQLQRARESQNLTQKQLAKQAGITQQQLSKLEHGANSNFQTYLKVASALGIEIRLSSAQSA